MCNFDKALFSEYICYYFIYNLKKKINFKELV